MTPLRKLLAATSLTGLTLLLSATVSITPASATVGGRFHYDHAQVVATRDALAKADRGCKVGSKVLGPLYGPVARLAACGNGIGQARDALEAADIKGCGVDVTWVDRGPLSYDGDQEWTVSCP